MKLVRIANEKSPHFEQAWKIYESSFPADERRDFSPQVALLANPNYSFFAALEDDQVIGVLGEWQFPHFTFMEHFAIIEHLRGKGKGTRFFHEHLDKAKHPVVGEAERPEVSDFARRRIELYKRVGFQINGYDYVQPPYAPEKSPVAMRMISFPKLLDEKQYESIRDTIHLSAYGMKKPILKIEK